MARGPLVLNIPVTFKPMSFKLLHTFKSDFLSDKVILLIYIFSFNLHNELQ